MYLIKTSNHLKVFTDLSSNYTSYVNTYIIKRKGLKLK